MQLISTFNKGIRSLLFVTDIYSKYVWFVPLKDKKGVTVVIAFQKYQMMQKENQIKYG